MSSAAGFFKSSCSSLFSWKSIGKLQQTLASCIKRTGTGLHTGEPFTVTISPEYAGSGRTFNVFGGAKLIPASIEFAAAATHSPLCTTLCKDGYSVRTVEHLLSALEACGVDNCTIYVTPANSTISDDRSVEVPIFDGSAIEWVEAVEQAGLEVARDKGGDSHEKMALFVTEPVHVQKNDSFLVALPSSSIHFSYGINFQQVPAIGCQWFSSSMEKSFYSTEIASSRTFCIFEQVEQMHNAGLARGGSLENAIVCSSGRGWLNPPLRFVDEPCRHKVLDLIGDFSLLAQFGSQGLPVAHIIAYKGGHALHTDFLRRLLSNN